MEVVMKQQPIDKSKPEKQVEIVDERTPKLPELQSNDSTVPVRTVVYMEVRDMSSARVLHLIDQINKSYEGNGQHYILPVRNGKLGGDIIFEHEIEEMINKLCEIRDGQIKLKGGAHEVQIVREYV
jgi:hypothetical protein